MMRNIDDDSILPRRYRLLPTVSATYMITASDELSAPVRVRIQHCAIQEKEGSLVFLKADDTPPYRFHPLCDGKFPLQESYGEIETKHFCSLRIIWSILGYRLKLALFVFYERDGGTTIVITKNELWLVNAVKFEYRNATKRNSTTISCDYTTKDITASLPKPPTEGWNIEPVFVSQIDMLDVHEYEPGKLCPKIELFTTWTGEGEPKEERISIKIKGDTVTPISLWCSQSTHPHSFTAGQLDCSGADLIHALKVLKGLDKDITKRVGLRLGLSPHTVNNYNPPTVSEYQDQILHDWIQARDNVNQNGGPTWNSLYNALQDEGLHGNAERVYRTN